MAEPDENHTMVCHYEVMELEMTCKADEIKKQYRVLALRYHPDRNHGNEEEATLKFKQLSAAYAVLNDPHERKWYDEHRDAILRGGNGTTGGEGDGPDLLNVWKYFNSSCYSGHDDESPTGFYQVFASAFDEVFELENDKTRADTSSKIGSTSTKFGNSTTPISEVLAFYADWENFASKLNFAWADLYHSVDAPNRATRRVMEKENSKARDTARKEYTGEIRSLARFVKKIDPRFLNYENEVKRRNAEQEELKKTQKAEALAERKKRREQQMLEHENDTEWQEKRNTERKAAFLLADNEQEEDEVLTIGMSKGEEEIQLQKELRKASLDDFIPGREGESTKNGAEGEEADATGEGGDGAFACELCAKSFETEAQLAHHCTNRQHRKKVQELAKKAPKRTPKAKSSTSTSPVPSADTTEV